MQTSIRSWLANMLHASPLLIYKIFVALILAFFLASPLFSADSNHAPVLKTKPGPPPGFEDLAKPQTTSVDIYYGGRNIGTTLATYTPNTVELESPSTIVSLIPRINNQIEVETALSGPLATNSEKVCLTEIQRDCGHLEPAVAGVIFDEGYFRLYVFINAYYLEQKEIVSNKYLPESSTEFSTVNLFSTNISGNDNNDTFTLGARHIAAHKQSRFLLDWNHTDTQDITVDTLSVQHDKSIWSTEAGIFDSATRNSSFINETDLLGARIFSSTNTRTDLEYSQSTEIFLFLTSHSLVEIFKDDKLVTVEEYEAGNQQIDTAHLPGGSYPIRLRITDARGSVREEEYFFVKSALLPPKDQPLYFAEFGNIGEATQNSTLREYTDEYLGRLGAAYRLHDNFGVEFEYLHGADVGILQGGAVYLGPNYNVQGYLMQSSENDWGIDVRGQMNRQNLSLNFNYRKVDKDENDTLNDFQLIPDNFTQSSLSASTLFADGTLSLRARYNKRLNQDSIESFGLEYRKPLYRRNRYQIDLTSSSFIEDGDLSAWIGFSFNRFAQNKQYTSDIRYVHQDDNNSTEQGLELSGEVTYSNNDPNFGNYSLGLFADDTLDRKAVGTRVRSQSSLGRGDFLYELVDDKTSGNFSRYFGNASFSIFSSGDEIAWGGNRNSRAGVIVALDSELQNSPFEVFVDRQPHGFAKTANSTVIGLRPYESYEIQIKPRGNDIVHFEDNVQTVTLYPGNVETLRWQVSPVTVLISNAVHEDGTPVANAKFENTINFASTDDGGWFQIEIANRKPLVLTKNGQPVCMITLPNFTAEQGVAVLDEVTCSPIQD